MPSWKEAPRRSRKKAQDSAHGVTGGGSGSCSRHNERQRDGFVCRCRCVSGRMRACACASACACACVCRLYVGVGVGVGVGVLASLSSPDTRAWSPICLIAPACTVARTHLCVLVHAPRHCCSYIE